ncbi:MAG: 2-amino-4-hydroxy-6-hydroxymethyldihydropteridine diphosphokinase [Methylophilaceae bacterium]
MHEAFVALGSNLENPASQIAKAFQAVAAPPKTLMVKQSSLYKTAPVGYQGQPDFINAVAKISTALTPQMLLEHLLAIEQTFGRQRTFANAPRILDLDLLLYDDISMQTENLILPHPRMHLRSFVLLPLAEIAPEIYIPPHGNVVKLALAFKDQGIEKLA